ncbi:probable carboxylesterase 3 [Oryza glaberrima]|uniref:Alpha/beta hydrolase fold-3 domain-containing protein n=1 Tax=Oryza glaberrima TaxID=4538 RepID=I1QE25_ORYGL|nr:probable carboxylesterase 3 [Oryza glaberrima]
MASMQEKMIREAMAAMNGQTAADVAVNLYPFIRKYTDGRVERLLTSSYVPASEDAGRGRGGVGVATRDVVVDRDNGVSARLFLPSSAATGGGGGGRRLPVVLYFHGGSFCTESAFCRTYHRYASSLASRAGALVVSVEYRLAPEHPIPAAYDDAWAAFRWVESLSDPWLAEYGDLRRTFVAGDSAGGNIAYHTVARAGRENVGGGIQGLIMVHPFFWGPERLPCETVWDGASVFPAFGVDWLWPFVTAGQADNDDPRIDPADDELASLPCRRVLMAVAGRDTLRDRGRRLASRMRGDVTVVESEGEDHGFHLYSPLRATSKRLMQSIVQFINQPPSPCPPPPAPAPSPAMRWPATILPELDEWSSTYSDDTANSSQILLGMPARAYKAIFVDRMDRKAAKTGRLSSNPTVNASLSIGPSGKASKTSCYGMSFGRTRAYNFRGVAAAGSGQCQPPFRGATI